MEFRQLYEYHDDGFVAGPIDEENMLEWEVLISGPEGTPYEYGVFSALLKFPEDYPMNPPTMRFTSDIFHPNVYPDGKVCISILHPPGDDPTGY
ncbi:ubiquitin-conjugating enzyme E2, partial [Salmonella sp. s51228]|uniref:ubiquitin-conjugating enzyme E2 n=1 Tax=Salmonella sp. s51228 TaxID=3159652 RepID=UPI00397F1079